MQAGHARRLLQDHSAILRLGGDQLADLSLAYQGRRVGAGRGVREEQLHVTRAYLTAVDAVGGALALVDPAHDFQNRIVVERSRRAPRGIVDRQRHLGVIPRSPPRGAGEDHIVHAAGPHGLGGIGAHHPAQRFQQVRFAASVRADDARDAGLDPELDRIDEGLESRKAQPLEVHALSPSRLFRRRPGGPAAGRLAGRGIRRSERSVHFGRSLRQRVNHLAIDKQRRR